MPRPPRLQFEGALYHVFSRGNRKEPIAHTDQDFRILERYMLDAARATAVVPRSWHPMPNHTHAAVETPHANVSEFMQRWLGRYAKYYNAVYKKVGHLFQGRFGSRLVDQDSYLREIIRYIHLNARRAHGDPKLLALAERYSSLRFFMGETGPTDVQNWIKPMLQLFGQTPEMARLNFAQFLADGQKNLGGFL